MLLVTTGRRVQVRVPPTTDHKKLEDSARGLLSDNGPTPLADALLEIDERFMTAKNRRPVFVILTGDGSESSTRSDDKQFGSWLDHLAARGVRAHAVVLKTGNGVPEAIAGAVVRATGGHFETVSSGTALGDKLKSIAESLK